jgi:single-strand DNA-binding protein
MASLNKVFLVGNLTRDPERSYTPKGMALTKFGMAVNHVYTTDAGEKREEANFFDIVVWGKQAEAAAQYLSKGRPVLIEGRLKYESWQNDKGEKRSKISIVAERLQFLGSGGGGGGQRGGQEFREGGAPERAERAPAETHAEEGAPEPPAGGREKDDIPF